MTVITLNPFDDVYVSGTPGDVINGVGGNDTLTASAGGNALNGGDGDDVLKGGAGNDTLTGDDTTNFSYRNILKGFGGNDVITSLSWYDQVDAGAGDDLVGSYAQQTSQVIDGGNGTDRVNILSLSGVNDPVNITFGSTFVCIIAGINGATYMNFESFEVILGIGANTIAGSNGNDRLLTAYLNHSNATVFFDAGFVRAGGGDDQVAFNGLTRVGSGIQRMNGGTGIDSLSWTGGEAVIGDLAIDALKGTMIADGLKFATFEQFETVSFTTYDPITGTFDYSGFSGTDSLRVGAQSSVIKTFGGDDFVSLTAGSGSVNGGSGNDFLRSDYPNGANVTLHGDQGDDLLFSGSGVAMLYGGDGADTIQADNSHSQVFGGNDDDTMSLSFVASQTGAGTALVDGGAGSDVLTLTLFPTTTALVLDLSTATITLANGAFITGVEGIRLLSSSGADDIRASNDARGALFNTIDGGFGNDTLRASGNGASLNGSFGLDVLLGAAGDDVLNGGFGADNETLRGNGGNDTLIGNSGRDVLVGGAGADSFTLTQYFESGITAITRDLVSDFKQAEGDKINLAGVDAMLVTGSLPNDTFVFIGAGPFSNVAGQLRYEKFNLAGTANDYTLVSGDLHGDSIADFTIEVKGLITFVATDFVL